MEEEKVFTLLRQMLTEIDLAWPDGNSMMVTDSVSKDDDFIIQGIALKVPKELWNGLHNRAVKAEAETDPRVKRIAYLKTIHWLVAALLQRSKQHTT